MIVDGIIKWNKERINKLYQQGLKIDNFVKSMILLCEIVFKECFDAF